MNLNFIRKNRTIFLIIIDIFCIVFGYLLALWIRMEFSFNIHASIMKSFFDMLPIVLILNIFSMKLFKANETLWKYISIYEALRVSLAIVSANMLWFVIILFVRIKNYPRSLPVIATLIILAEMLGFRLMYRYIRKETIQKSKYNNTLIIGAGDAGVVLSRELLSDRYNERVVGFIDDAKQKVGKTISGIKVLGTTDDLEEIVEKYNINIAYIAIVNASQNEIKKIIKKCQNINLKIKMMSYHNDKFDGKAQIRDVSIDDLLGRGEIKLNNYLINSYIKDKVIMVTGAGGSIGSELCRQIVKYKPKELVLIDIYENNMYELQQEILMNMNDKQTNNIKLTCLIASIRDENRINEIIKFYKPFVVYHAAAHKHVPLVEDSPIEAIKNNVFGTKNVIDSCIKNNVENFVLISTDKAVNPTNVMGATKRMCELMIQGYRNNNVTKLCAVRFGNVLGSNGSVIPLFKKQIENGGPVTVTDPEIIRYFMTIPEAAQLVLQASTYAKSGEIFVLDMGTPIKILTLAENLIRLSGFKPYEDIKIVFTGLRPGEKMFEELTFNMETAIKTENDLIFIAEPIDITKKEIDIKLNELVDYIIKGSSKEIKKDIMNIIK
ncbi:MAG: polysaccharide biosynthesis protein [Erysipelotrichaceae bacterium]|nr:polysaccharide biosynthesis protein [Erysipelotrichaceae bacterium]